MILSDTVLEVVRRELRRVSPDVRIGIESIRTVLVNEVIKREVSEGDKADEAGKKISRSSSKSLRNSAAKDIAEAPAPEPTSATDSPTEPDSV